MNAHNKTNHEHSTIHHYTPKHLLSLISTLYSPQYLLSLISHLYSPKCLLSLLSYLSLASFAAFADFSVGYQGKLCDSTGKAVSAQTQQIAFRLYESASDDKVLWGRKYAVRTGTNGVFNVELCDTTGSTIDGVTGTGLQNVISGRAGNSLPVYVGLTVENSSGEIAPRQRMLSAPYAAYACDVSEAHGDFTVNGELCLKGSVVMTDITNNYLKAGNVTANTLTSTGIATLNGEVIAKGAVQAQGGLTVSGGNLGVVGDGKIMQGGYELLPRGVIVMWSGTTPPDGWALCDGQTDGVPDLRGRFIVGLGKLHNESGDEIGDTNYTLNLRGGDEKVKLEISEMPSHNHNINEKHAGKGMSLEDGGHGYYTDFMKTTNDDGWGVNLSELIDKTGGDQAHENRPPFYALAYIMKL